MIDKITLTLLYLIGIALLLAFNELAYRKLKLKGEITRKFAHFSTALATIPFPYIFQSHWHVLALAAVFAIMLFLTRYKKQLNSIHDIERKSMGSFLLPIAVYVIFLISFKAGNKLMYILPMIILAVCDPIAAILGMSGWKGNGKIKLFGWKSRKTYFGSAAFLLTSFVISVIALYYYRQSFDLKTFWLALVVAVVGTLSELICWRGSDNLTIPLSVAIVLVIFL